ncbi:hypothetical protein HDV63DRAFT_364341 [Trichoderma sp. SZMC 28014]
MPRHCFRFFFFLLVFAPLWIIKSPLLSLHGNYGRGPSNLHMLACASSKSISTMYISAWWATPFGMMDLHHIHVSLPTNKTCLSLTPFC